MNAKAKVDCCCFGKTYNGILFFSPMYSIVSFFHTKKLMFLLKFHI